MKSMVRDSVTIRDIVKEERAFQKSRPNSAYVPKFPKKKKISRNQRRFTGLSRKTRPITAKNIKPQVGSKKLIIDYIVSKGIE